jgi:uncharacterized protein
MSRSGPRRTAALVLAILALGARESRGQGSPPPPPARHLNDYAHLVPEADAKRLDEKLQRFQDETSNDVVVALFPELPPDAALEDFTVRTAQDWRTGRKGLNNGVVLFVFAKDRKLRLEVGYGLEGALPDAIAKRIIEDEITPRFRSGDFAGGLDAGIEAIFKATRGEYKPAPKRVQSPLLPLLLFLAVILLMAWLQSRAGPTIYSRSGWRTYRRGPWGGGWGAGGGGIGYGGWGGGSGGGGGGGGGYSGGGGGQFGGGGASGSW